MTEMAVVPFTGVFPIEAATGAALQPPGSPSLESATAGKDYDRRRESRLDRRGRDRSDMFHSPLLPLTDCNEIQ